MKILILQTKGKHKENVDFRESLCMQRALDRIEGIETYIYGPGYELFNMSFEKLCSLCDCIFILENYSKRDWIPDLSKIKKLKVFWSIDSHLSSTRARHLNFVKKNRIDCVLNSTQGFVKHFKSSSCQSIWFPNCYPIDLITPLDIQKSHQVGFCGNYVNRKKWIDNLSKHFKLKRDIFIIGLSMIKAVNSYKIHFNKNYANDINYRTFETLGCRTFLITNKTDKLTDLFTINKHLVTYKNFNDCVEKIKYYLQNEGKRNQIAKAGYNHVKKFHTYDNRASKFIEIINGRI